MSIFFYSHLFCIIFDHHTQSSEDGESIGQILKYYQLVNHMSSLISSLITIKEIAAISPFYGNLNKRKIYNLDLYGHYIHS